MSKPEARQVVNTPATRQLMEAVSDDMQRILNQTIDGHAGLEGSGSAIVEGTLFALCAVVYQGRPDGMTGPEVAELLAQQSLKYMTSFDAESLIGAPQGNA